MILESVVTTVSSEGQINIAPMGPHVDDLPTSDAADGTIFTLRPFDSSRTYRNLLATPAAVIHVTDDVELFARAAVDAISPAQAERLVRAIEGTPWRVLKDCHRWFAVTVESVEGAGPRFDLRCRVSQSGVVRPFFGFNRAKHAVIEAAILATRTHLLSPEAIEHEWSHLQPLVDKTAGHAERAAFDFLRKTIDERITSQS